MIPSHIQILSNSPATQNIHITCPWCRGTKTMPLDRSDFQSWQAGAYVQNVFHYLSADDRERLISGVCPKCWKETFGDDSC